MKLIEDTQSSPHILVKAFERLILFPVDICILGAGIIFLIEKVWLFGGFLLLMAVFLGIVGQRLPHNKKLTNRQLASQKDIGDRFGRITPEESNSFAKAVITTALLVSIVIGAGALHHNRPWYWVMAYVVASWFLFPLCSVLFCFAWAWIMERMYGQSPDGAT
jgi:hypothetical protein